MGQPATPKSGKEQATPKSGKEQASAKPGKGQDASKTGKGQDQAGKQNAKKPEKSTGMKIWSSIIGVVITLAFLYFIGVYLNSDAGKAAAEAYANRSQ